MNKRRLISISIALKGADDGHQPSGGLFLTVEHKEKDRDPGKAEGGTSRAVGPHRREDPRSAEAPRVLQGRGCHKGCKAF